MKKYLFIVLAAVISLFSSCAEDDAAIGLSGLKVSQSYVALPVEGGSTDITIESKSEWIITGNDKADWLTISTTQGPQGESKITFSADEAVDGRSVELKLSSANETQNLTIMQGLPVISEATCAEVIAGPDKKTYKVTGVVSNISIIPFLPIFSPMVVATRRQPIMVPIPSASATAIIIQIGAYSMVLSISVFSFFSRRLSSAFTSGSLATLSVVSEMQSIIRRRWLRCSTESVS